MCPQIACLRRGIFTLVTSFRLFSTVYFEMSSQVAFHRGCILTLVAFVWFFSFIICVSQGNINIDHTFTKFIIFKILIHHNQVGNVVPCYCRFRTEKELPIRRENKWKWEWKATRSSTSRTDQNRQWRQWQKYMVGIWLCLIPTLHYYDIFPPGGNVTGGNLLGNHFWPWLKRANFYIHNWKCMSN